MKHLIKSRGAAVFILFLCTVFFVQHGTSIYSIHKTAGSGISPMKNSISPMPVILSDQTFKQDEIVAIHHSGYLSQMHKVYNIPVWVSHTISHKMLKQADSLHLTRSKNAPSGYPKDPGYTVLKSNLYNSTGYDHGHLAPAADFGYNQTYYNECFYMTNMAPQHGCMNQKGWCYLESQCRTWARENPGSIMYIVSGPVLKSHKQQPVFSDTLCIKKNLKVYVPSSFFKAVCIYDEKNNTAQSVGFIVPNSDVSNDEVKTMHMSIDELELATGLDLFSDLSDELEAETEANLAALKYNAASDCGNGKACTSVYSRRTTPGKRTKCRCGK